MSSAGGTTWSRTLCRPVLCWSLVLSLLPSCSRGALNIDADGGSQKLINTVRNYVFIDTAYLSSRREKKCSSLDGPKCLSGNIGNREPGSLPDDVVTGPETFMGVFPEFLLRDFGVANWDDYDFTLPSYHVFEAAVRAATATTWKKALAAAIVSNSSSLDLVQAHLAATDDIEALRRGSLAHPSHTHSIQAKRTAVANLAKSEQGVLHFAGLTLDRRLPLTLSQGLPFSIVATFDGRWIARDCLQPTMFRVPTSSIDEDNQDAAAVSPLLLRSPPSLGRSSMGVGLTASMIDDGVTAVAELSGSIGYLRFSKPVVVRSLIARWSPPFGTPPAVVGGRLGLRSVWSTHFDPSRPPSRTISGGNANNGAWLDISSGSLEAVDEIVFAAARGLQLGAVWIVASIGFSSGHAIDADSAANGNRSIEDVVATGGTIAADKWPKVQARSVLLMSPVHRDDLVSDNSDDRSHFSLRVETIVPAASQCVMSLQEVIDNDLRLNLERSRWGLPHSLGAASNYPALQASVSTPVEQWSPEASFNRALVEQRRLLYLHRFGVLATTEEEAMAIVQAVEADASLPPDIQRQLASRRHDVVQALLDWVVGGDLGRGRGPADAGVADELPVLAFEGAEEDLARYVFAKRRQETLDLLAVANLYMVSTLRHSERSPDLVLR